MAKRESSDQEKIAVFQNFGGIKQGGTHTRLAEIRGRLMWVECDHCRSGEGHPCSDCGRREGCDDGWRGDDPMGPIAKSQHGCGCWLCPVCDDEFHHELHLEKEDERKEGIFYDGLLF